MAKWLNMRRLESAGNRKPFAEQSRSGFTMNELMIAGAVIGIIASITVPILLVDTSNKRNQVTSDKVNLAITNALKAMRIEGTLTGNTTTETFMGEFKKHMTFNKICSKDELAKCFTPTFTINGEEKELKDYTTATQLGKEWNTNVNGAVLNDGTNMLIAYNPSCSKFAPEDCVATIYDTNGFKPDNTFGGVNGVYDINTYNMIVNKDENANCNWSTIEAQCGSGAGPEIEICINSALQNSCKTEDVCTELQENLPHVFYRPYWDSSNGRCKFWIDWTDPA